MDDNSLLFNVCNKYTAKLQETILIGLYEGLKQMWDLAKVNGGESGEVYREFQNNLKNVKKWNQDIVLGEFKRIVERSKCEWLDDLIKQVFKLNTQYLASVDSRTALMRIKVSIPDTPTFIHECYVNIARAFWLNVPLLEDRPQKINKFSELENFEKAKVLIKEAIMSTIMENVPMRELAHESLQVHSESEPDLDDDADDHDPSAHENLFNHTPAPSPIMGPVPPASDHEWPPPWRLNQDVNDDASSPWHTNKGDDTKDEPAGSPYSRPPSRSPSIRSTENFEGDDNTHTAAASRTSSIRSTEGLNHGAANDGAANDGAARNQTTGASRTSSLQSNDSGNVRDGRHFDNEIWKARVKPRLETVESMDERRSPTPPDEDLHFFSDATEHE